MIDLGQRSEPYEIALPYGLTVTVKPLTTAGMAAAQAAARRVVQAIERQACERVAAGLELDGLPDLSAEGERDGFYQAQLIRALAVRHVTSWSGVELGGRTGTADAREHCRGDGTCMGLLLSSAKFGCCFSFSLVLGSGGTEPVTAGRIRRSEGSSPLGRDPIAPHAYIR
jgi:hypothetical protein